MSTENQQISANERDDDDIGVDVEGNVLEQVANDNASEQRNDDLNESKNFQVIFVVLPMNLLISCVLRSVCLP